MGPHDAVRVGTGFEVQNTWLGFLKVDKGVGSSSGVRRELPQFFYSRATRCDRSRMVIASRELAEREGTAARPPARPRADDPGSAGRRDRPPRRGTTPARG